jgi:protocatechuate 3,4-dioxygenase beta subunit
VLPSRKPFLALLGLLVSGAFAVTVLLLFDPRPVRIGFEAEPEREPASAGARATSEFSESAEASTPAKGAAVVPAMEPQGAAVFGRVLDPRGEPLPGAAIAAYRLEPPRGELDAKRVPAAGAESGAAGEYRLASLSPGSYILAARRSPFPLRWLPVTVGGEELRQDIQFPPLLTISGRLVAADGRPLEGGVEVRRSRLSNTAGEAWLDVEELLAAMELEDDVEREEIPSDAEGRFATAALAPGFYHLRARAPGFAPAVLPAVEAGAAELEIRLEPGVALRGRVRFEDGAPAPGVEVLASAPAPLAADPWSRHQAFLAQPEVARCITDGEGRFELVELGRGLHVLRLGGGGAIEEVIDGVAVEPEAPAVEVTLRRAGRIAGRVTGADGQPLSNVRLELSPPLPAQAQRTSTGAAGEFAFESLRLARHRLAIHSSGGHAGVILHTLTPGDPPLEVRLREGATLRGQLLDAEDGRGIEGAALRYAPSSGAPVPPARSGGDGHFLLEGLPPGAGRLEVRAPGYVLAAAGPLDPAALEEALEIELRRAGTLSGVVRDPQGRPIERARLDLTAREISTLQQATSPAGQHGWTLSDASGRFTMSLSALAGATGVCRLEARHPEYAGAASIDLGGIDPSGSLEGLELVLEPGGAITGSVRSLSGPLGGVLVRLRRFDDRGEEAELPWRTLSGATGRFAVRGLAAGEYMMRVDAPGFAPYQSDRLRVAGERETEHEIVLEAEAALSGRITDSEGSPLRGAEVRAVDPAWRDLRSGERVAVSDQEGRWRLGSLRAGRYILSASLPWQPGASQREAEAPAEGVGFVLGGSGSLVGRVVEAGSGAPIGSFRLGLVPAVAGEGAPIPEREFGDPDGAFLLEDMSPGTYVYRVRAAGYLAAGGSVRVESGVAGEGLLIELERGRSVLARVTDTRGRPLPGAAVRALPVAVREDLAGAEDELAARLAGGDLTQALFKLDHSRPDAAGFETGEKGEALVSGLAGGAYVLEAAHPDHPAARSLPFTPAAAEGPPAEIQIALPDGRRLEGLVRSRDGAPVGEGIVLLGGAGRQSRAEVQAGGRFRFRGLVPGSYRLTYLDPATGPAAVSEVTVGAEDLYQELFVER